MENLLRYALHQRYGVTKGEALYQNLHANPLVAEALAGADSLAMQAIGVVLGTNTVTASGTVATPATPVVSSK